MGLEEREKKRVEAKGNGTEKWKVRRGTKASKPTREIASLREAIRIGDADHSGEGYRGGDKEIRLGRREDFCGDESQKPVGAREGGE